MNKPGRPLGLSLAIIISFMLFTVLPLMQVAFVLYLQQQFSAIEFLETGGAIGGGLEVADAYLILPAINGLIFAVVAVLAWRGKHKNIRLIFLITVLAITLITVGMTMIALRTPASLEQGFDSASNLTDTLLSARAVFSILVALYVIWYVNRGPARAFYRGYYLPSPEDSPEHAQQPDHQLIEKRDLS